MANVNVTYAELSNTASQLKNGQAQIEQKLSELKKLVDNLIQEGFVTDKASGAFGASYTEFNTGVSKTIQGLQGMAQFLNQAAQSFQSTDDSLSSAISN